MSDALDIPRSEHPVFVAWEMNEDRPSSHWSPCVWMKTMGRGLFFNQVLRIRQNPGEKLPIQVKNAANRTARSHEIVWLVCDNALLG